MKKIPRLFVLCYPHLGLLDNWLPVMNSMNNMANYLNFTLVIPDVTTIKSFHGDNALIKISDNIFDTVLIHAYEDTWIKHESVFDSMKWYQTNKVMFRLFGILERLKKKHMFFYILIWPLALLRNKIFKKKYRLEYKEFGRNMSKLDILFYDIATEGNTNPVVSSVLQLFKNSKYSFPHAISMSALEKKSVVPINVSNKNNIKDYVFGKFQTKYHESKYGINKIRVVGIPRHDRNWIKTIQEYSPRLPDNFDDENTVVVLSKRASNLYFLFDNKVETLKNIKKIFIDELGMKVAVKFHPKEKKERIYKNKEDDIYENIFGLDNYGLTWIYSGLHSFALCKGKKLVISLGAGVIFDMIAMGAPCIEYKNKKENEEKITQFVKYGFVEGFSSYHELSAYVNKWKIGSNQVSTTPINTYKKYFPVFNDISRVIATEILQDNEIIDR